MDNRSAVGHWQQNDPGKRDNIGAFDILPCVPSSLAASLLWSSYRYFNFESTNQYLKNWSFGQKNQDLKIWVHKTVHLILTETQALRPQQQSSKCSTAFEVHTGIYAVEKIPKKPEPETAWSLSKSSKQQAKETSATTFQTIWHKLGFLGKSEQSHQKSAISIQDFAILRPIKLRYAPCF